MKTNKWMNWLGKLLMILSFLFIGWQVSKYRVDFTAYISPLSITVCIAVICVYAGTIALNAYAFQKTLGVIAEKKITYTKVLHVYTQANLYKYLPGNVMHYVGRNQLAIEENLTHTSVAITSMLEIICLAAVGAMLSLILAFDPLFQWLGQYPPSSVWLFVGGVFLLLAIGFFLIKTKISKKLRKFRKIIHSQKGVFMLFRTSLVMAIGLLLNGIAFFVLLRISIPEITNAGQIIGIYVLAWLMGFITPGAPGGLGIREAVMTMFLGSYLPSETILTTLIVSRVISIAGDVVGYGVASWRWSVYSRKLAFREKEK